MENFDYIKRNYEKLKTEISALSEKYGRAVRLVCVTKSGTDEELLALVEAGASDIGENRPGELKRRGELLRQHGYTPKLHEIGNLQRNKVKLIVDIADLVHSVGSLRLAAEIDRQAKALGITVPVLAEINSAEEDAKGGRSNDDAEEFVKELKGFENLSVKGLMTMGPVCENPEDIRPYFKLVKSTFDKLKDMQLFDGEGILSMGMSDSYKIAIEEGSTLVRVGRRLFEK